MSTEKGKYMQLFVPKNNGKAKESQIILLNKCRITVIADRLIRVEHNGKNIFTDKPTQTVICRDIGDVKYNFSVEKGTVKIVTAKAAFCYNFKKQKMESISLADGSCVTDFEKGNLLGTCRTLDMTAGKTKLEKGLVSTSGVAVLDDSKSLVLEADGRILPRESKQKDIYFFAYGKDYRGAIRALYAISGEVPLVPRFCLGNWWSRYKAYSQEEYLELMHNFVDREIPITVATIDMDWHWVDVIRRFGKEDAGFRFKPLLPQTPNDLVTSQGWTGYSWNTELFPDYKAMLNELHEMNFKVPLNIHPAQGVRPFEDMYDDMARAMGLNPKDKQHIRFDITDPQYIEAYFSVLHEPYEKDGIDFWWIDWQQGKNTGIPGLDPLWALNHYHYIANSNTGKRPLILSRYAGIGSHRYPLGFSGDTVICWDALKFQPYFTANAANAGYSWWSHDIGGHCFGIKDDELYLRWVQLGVFSPIMRLHSTSNEFTGKEPWKFSPPVEKGAVDCLRLRHRLIPYIYSMNYLTHTEGNALCEPMYYNHPDEKEAYTVGNEYYFGTELICAPITEKINSKTNLAPVKVWLPKGNYTDIFNGRVYVGGQYVTMYRGLTEMPVLAREGAIVPLAVKDRTNDYSNPDTLEVLLFNGNGSFTLYEDDGETEAYKDGVFAKTAFSIKEGGRNVYFKLSSPVGDASVLPEKRSWKFAFRNVAEFESIEVKVGTRNANYTLSTKNGYVCIELQNIPVDKSVSITLYNIVKKANQPLREGAIDVISKFQQSCDFKLAKYYNYMKDPAGRIPAGEPFKGPLEELRALKY